MRQRISRDIGIRFSYISDIGKLERQRISRDLERFSRDCKPCPNAQTAGGRTTPTGGGEQGPGERCLTVAPTYFGCGWQGHIRRFCRGRSAAVDRPIYQIISDGGLHHGLADQIWKPKSPLKVFTFGSVPLKTYLPDGDIDMTAFSKNLNLKDTWANEVRDMLENEEKSENAEFRVKEVQYIQAEVKLIKCLVENIVVDISFNQLGGLCTLCFLEQIDQTINQDHLFKRSIILIKAWCYYESRILGAHHGLISTYALEILVLYIFHIFNNSFAGPLEVLYRFLVFFSNFDWDNFCVSLWGPVPISSLPDMTGSSCGTSNQVNNNIFLLSSIFYVESHTAEPPRKDDGKLFLSKHELDTCSSMYSVFPGGQENQGQPFVSKFFNVIDPLRTNNNLGRSVSKGPKGGTLWVLETRGPSSGFINLEGSPLGSRNPEGAPPGSYE
ncbi:hypothetical protein Taro_001337 [Colocasia esculenta]|uniref:Polymerase nucleotidyl transferase domain-containing protein n=1 Tax=Colocasia esculenta TaxID=4460 RepID=A0A843TFY3_COLES|nr:hypothetical protein [Colocasia esculenta]